MVNTTQVKRNGVMLAYTAALYGAIAEDAPEVANAIRVPVEKFIKTVRDALVDHRSQPKQEMLQMSEPDSADFTVARAEEQLLEWMNNHADAAIAEWAYEMRQAIDEDMTLLHAWGA